MSRQAKIIAIGDNVVDMYLSRGKMYPGGQCLNTCVYSQMNGGKTAYLGKFGDDAAAIHNCKVIDEIGIDNSHSRHYHGENGAARVTLINGDRVFLGSNKGGVAKEHPFDFTKEDLDYIKTFDLIYTNGNSYTLQDLPLLKATGLPIVTEIMSAAHLDLFDDVDVIQVGARNMQNFELLKELGKINKPILLKRGMSSTIDELLMSAEYIMAGGNEQVILCERGIRTFETSMRNTLDISAVPMLKSKTHLPVIVDPSHAAGIRFMVEPLTMAAIAAGADGVMIEVHNNPEKALCDGMQSLTPQAFDDVMKKVKKTTEFFGKVM